MESILWIPYCRNIDMDSILQYGFLINTMDSILQCGIHIHTMDSILQEYGYGFHMNTPAKWNP